MTDGIETTIVQRDDPQLHATALFASEPTRSRLMVLYAFDCELDRAVQSSKESLIPRMRLQWWRDAIAEAGERRPPKAHEVAAPLAELLATPEHAAIVPMLQRMIDARELELDGPDTGDDWRRWAEHRFQARVQAATILLDPSGADVPDVAEPMALAFALRSARAMAMRDGRVLLPGVRGGAVAAIARGENPEAVIAQVREHVRDALETVETAKKTHRASRAAIPALLPLSRDARVLRLASAPAFGFGDLDQIDRPFDGLKLACRAGRRSGRRLARRR